MVNGEYYVTGILYYEMVEDSKLPINGKCTTFPLLWVMYGIYWRLATTMVLISYFENYSYLGSGFYIMFLHSNFFNNIFSSLTIFIFREFYMTAGSSAAIATTAADSCYYVGNC